ncbi:MAG: glycoside hydrolase family 5 protein, partial [Ruminococcus sp.]
MINKKITSFISAAAVAIASVPVIISDVDTTNSAIVFASEEYSVPNLNIAGKKIPDTESFRFVNDMGAGFNLGNTFDAIDNAGAVDGDANMYIETSWLSDGEAGLTTTETIDAIKKAGFTTVRIPVSWHNHLDSSLNINEEWLGKVSSIVNYALSQNMYVILNIHHDCEKSSGFTNPDYDPAWATGNKDCYIYPDNEHLESSINYVTRIWEQLGSKFKDCDNHLIFETMNEPRQVGNIHEWWYADDDC